MEKPERRWAIAAERHTKILELLRRGFGVIRVARVAGVGVRTVQRRVELLRADAAEEDANDLEPVGIDFIRSGSATRKCPEHGLVAVWPCVMCEAIKALREGRKRSE